VFATIINIPDDQPTIQEGINVAVDGDTILVQPGTYVENIDFVGKNVTVASLFLTTQDTTYIYQTVVDGDQNGSVVTFESGEDSTAVLLGLKIRNGYGGSYQYQNGGGITCKNFSNPQLKYLHITDNWSGDGGGIYCLDSDPILEHLLISENTTGSDGYGGGIFFKYSNAVIKNVVIQNNNAPFGEGGGINCLWSDPILENVIIIGNDGQYSGGLSCYESNLTLMNVIIAKNINSIWDSASVKIRGTSNSNFVNVIIVDNDISSIRIIDNSIVNLVNCIIWNNPFGSIDGTLEASFSNIQGGYQGVGNINADPLFIDPENDDYHLLGFSPCIDSGTPDTIGLNLPPYDLDNNVRIWDGNDDGIAIIDMGAYEFGSIPFVSIEDHQIYEENFLLYNYPNPFNPSTTISFYLNTENTENTEISIFNIKGQKVKTLVNERLNSGLHSYNWNGDDNSGRSVSSGIYFYKLKTGDGRFTSTKKMILMK